jgi:hypothetical protein
MEEVRHFEEILHNQGQPCYICNALSSDCGNGVLEVIGKAFDALTIIGTISSLLVAMRDDQLYASNIRKSLDNIFTTAVQATDALVKIAGREAGK